MFAALLTASGLGVSGLSNNENVPSHWIRRVDCISLTIDLKRFVESFGATVLAESAGLRQLVHQVVKRLVHQLP